MISYNLFFDYINKNKLLIFSYLILYVFAYSLESLFLPRLSANLFTNFSKTKINTIYRSLIYITLTWVVIQTTFYIVGWMDSKITPDIWVLFRDYIINNLYYRYENNYQDLELGKVSTELSTIPGNFIDFINLFFENILPRLLIILVMTIYFFTINWKIGALFIGLFIPFAIFYYYKLNSCTILSNERYQKFKILMENFQDKFSNLATVYTSGNMYKEMKKSQKEHNEYGAFYADQMLCTNNLKMIGFVFNIIIFISMNLLNVYLFLKNEITSTIFIALFITFLYVINHVSRISYQTPHLILRMGIINETDKFLEKITLLDREETRGDMLEIRRGKIEFRDVSFGYNTTSYKILNNIKLTIEPRTKICILGSSGSGKSTLLKLLLKFYKPNNGIIMVDDIDIQNCDTNNLRKQISYVNQNTKLFQDTIYENIRYSNSELTDNIIDNKIDEFGLKDIFKNINNDYTTQCGVQGNNLSGGQRQTIILLREFLNKSKIMILDEPTAAIDDYHKKYIYNFIDKIGSNKTVVVITHDRSNLNIYDKVYELKDGKIKKFN